MSQKLTGDIYSTVVDSCDRAVRFVLATVLETDGSTPCKAGSKALLSAQDVLAGTIGGGHVEAEAQRRTADVIASGRPVVLEFNLESRIVSGADPICGGAMRVLLDPTTARHRDVFVAASDMRLARRRGVLITAMRGGEELTVEVTCLGEEAITPDLGFPGAEAVRSVLAKEQARLFTAESPESDECVEVLVEPLIPQPVLLIVGGGHVGQAVAAQAALVGFETVVIDDRPEFTRVELFPGDVITRCGPITEELTRFPIEADTYVVIVTRGHNYDAEALAACLAKPAGYIGMIGSRRKVAMMRKEFIDSGRATAEQFDRVYAPIGLEIGSVTVPEIAASIVAQLIAVRRGGVSSRISKGADAG